MLNIWKTLILFVLLYNLFDLLLLDRNVLGEAVVVAVTFCSPSDWIMKRENFVV
jgi:hypothetical protein